MVSKDNTFIRKSMRVGNTFLDLTNPQVMGILNLTPDSFYDGGRLRSEKEMLSAAERHVQAGACILDLGGYSSRPGAQDVSLEEELRRTTHATSVLARTFPEVLISIDTFRVPVAQAALEAGAGLVNDISAGTLDKGMLDFVIGRRVPYVLMHMRGSPQTMSQQTDYEDVVQEVFCYLENKLSYLTTRGHADVLLDPGLGFAKTIAQSFELLQSLDYFKALECPLLVGVSRKSMIYKTLHTAPAAALNGTTALHMAALERGASILRVHDVAEAMEAIALFKQLRP